MTRDDFIDKLTEAGMTFDGHVTKGSLQEVDKKTGEVVSVWFRCMALPFDVHEVGPERAKEMRRMTKQVNAKESIFAVDVRSGDFQEGTVIEEMK